MASLSVSSWMSYAYSRFIRTYLRVFFLIYYKYNISICSPLSSSMSNFTCSQYAVHVLLQISSQLPICTRWLHTFTHPCTKTHNRKDGGHLSKLTLDPLTSIAFAPLSSQSAKPLLCCQYICLYQWKECSVLRKRMSGHSTLSTDITVELLDYFICLFFSFALFEQILMLRLFSVGACSRCFNRKQNSGLRILILKSILSSSFFLSDLRKSERISNVWIYICYIIEPWCSTGVPRYTSVSWEFIN